MASCIRLVDFPILLRRKTDACPVRTAALVGATEGGCRCPGCRDQLGDRQARSEDLALEGGDVLFIDQFMIDCRNRVLPDQFFRRDFRAEIARAGAHVAVGQLEPRPGEGVCKLFRVLMEASCNRLVYRVHPHRHVRGGHDDRDPLRRFVSCRCEIVVIRLFRRPLPSAGGTLSQFPLVAEQHVQIAIVPLRRGRRPCAFQTAANLICAFTAAMAASPAEALLFDTSSLGCRSDQRRIASAVAFAKGVSANGERDGLLVVHGHARERLPNIQADGIGSGSPFGPSGFT